MHSTPQTLQDAPLSTNNAYRLREVNGRVQSAGIRHQVFGSQGDKGKREGTARDALIKALL